MNAWRSGPALTPARAIACTATDNRVRRSRARGLGSLRTRNASSSWHSEVSRAPAAQWTAGLGSRSVERCWVRGRHGTPARGSGSSAA